MSSEKLINFKKNIASHLKKLRKATQTTINKLQSYTKIEQSALNEYETGRIAPSIPKLIIICQYFGISIDFLIHWNKTKYPRNIKLLALGERIDKLDQVKRFQIESTVYSLLGSNNTKGKISDEDLLSDLELSSDFHKNLNILRKDREYTQQQIAQYLNITNAQVSFYEKKDFPSIDKLIKLSDFFNVSIHVLLTGECLYFKFNNNDFKKAMLLADHCLSLKDVNILIHLMQCIIKDSE